MARFGGGVLRIEGRRMRTIAAVLTALVFVVALAAPGAQGQNDKKKKKNQPEKVDNNSTNPIVPLTDEQQIDYMLSEYLGAWQIGDTERLHKFYVEDVSVVNGGWAAPILGWQSFLAQYQQQRSHIQQVRMDRMNTYIKVSGTTAWACYQWEFEAAVDGTPTMAHGQTTLVLLKKDKSWLIAHDHTSVVETSRQQRNAPGSAPTNTPPPASKSPSR